MKIAIDGRLINKSQNTGISRYTEFLIEYYLTKYQHADLVLIVNDINVYYEGIVSIYCENKPYDVMGYLNFDKIVKSMNIDLLHSPFYSGLYKSVSSTKNIITVHDLMYKLVPNFFDKNFFINYLKIKYFDFIVKRSLKNATQLISVSETTQRDVLKIFNFNSVHIPEDSEILSKPDDAILEKYGLHVKGYFFYCGNNRPHKNIKFIADIFNSNHILPPLILAGQGHCSGENVRYVGLISDEELNALYTNAIAFVFPSKYEGFGLPILESLRNRSLVVASNISAFKEFKSSNILFFEQNNEEEFLKVLKNAQSKIFVDEPEFFKYYDKRKIYKLLDDMIGHLL